MGIDPIEEKSDSVIGMKLFPSRLGSTEKNTFGGELDELARQE
jgi:hypothetical protein